MCGLGSLTPQPRNFHSQCTCVCPHNRGKCHFISMLPQHWTLSCFWNLSSSIYINRSKQDSAKTQTLILAEGMREECLFYSRLNRQRSIRNKTNIAEEMFLHALHALGIAPEHNSQAWVGLLLVLLTFGTLDSKKT